MGSGRLMLLPTFLIEPVPAVTPRVCAVPQLGMGMLLDGVTIRE
jgi:hypothetical protein